MHPGRQHRIAARHAQPGDEVGDGMVKRGVAQVVLDQRGEARGADVAVDCLSQVTCGCLGARAWGATHQRKEGAHTAGCCTEQEMEQGDLVRASAAERLECLQLFAEELEAQLRIAQRVVARIADQLVVLDQPVIGVLREGKRRELQRVDDRELG